MTGYLQQQDGMLSVTHKKPHPIYLVQGEWVNNFAAVMRSIDRHLSATTTLTPHNRQGILQALRSAIIAAHAKQDGSVQLSYMAIGGLMDLQYGKPHTDLLAYSHNDWIMCGQALGELLN